MKNIYERIAVDTAARKRDEVELKEIKRSDKAVSVIITTMWSVLGILLVIALLTTVKKS
jgi:hypothetical protein